VKFVVGCDVLHGSASLNLAYNELSIDSKKRDEKMRSLDPKKQQQMERLGMAGGSHRQVQQLAFDVHL